MSQELSHVHKLKGTGSKGVYARRANLQKNPLKTLRYATQILQSQGKRAWSMLRSAQIKINISRLSICSPK